MTSRWPRVLPRSLFGRLMLILLCGLAAAQLLTFGLLWYERTRASQSMMAAYLARDVASSIAILERVPPQERASWLQRLDRRNYRYRLGTIPAGKEQAGELDPTIAASLAAVLGPAYRIGIDASPDDGRPRLRLQLHDGTPLAIELNPASMPLAEWLPALLAAQLALIVLSCLLAVRIATRPLAQLAQAAEAISPESAAQPVAEHGPAEVAKAARSFNAMQARIAQHLQERTRILAAISHDLQTPVTRMRLRTELMEESAERSKWQADLDAMQSLIQEGIAYARSAHAATEQPMQVDIDALLHALAADYQDAGQAVELHGAAHRKLTTRPQALRRIVSNLVDNALKFAGSADIEVTAADGRISIAVLDRGPGIPEHEQAAVLQPFYRLESSRNPETGGSGLGLAIAQQLSAALGGELTIANRKGGGLRASLDLPLPALPEKQA